MATSATSIGCRPWCRPVYVVRVRGGEPANGVSRPSAEVSVTVSGSATCVTPPPAPIGYTAQTGGLLVALSWAASPSATGYILEAGSGPGLANLVNSRLGNVTTFTATAPAGTYYTRVRAMNDCGVSTASSVEVPVTLGCSAEAVVPGGLTVTESGGAASLQLAAAARRDGLPDSRRDRAWREQPGRRRCRRRHRGGRKPGGCAAGTLLRAGRGGERVRHRRAVERGRGQRALNSG